MKVIYIYLLLLTSPFLGVSQNFDWMRTVGDIRHDFGEWVETDSVGNIYVAGMGQGTCNFGSNVIASADPFWFVAKYDSTGNNVWVTEIPFSNGFLFEMRDFKINRRGETFIVGSLNTNGLLYGILVKIDGAGNLIQQVTPHQTSNVTSIDFDSNGNYYIGGSYGNSMFISRYSPTGNLFWQVFFTGNYDLYDNLSLRVSSDDGLMFSFVFKNTVNVIDHLTGNIQLNATQGILDADRVIARYNANGTLAWAQKYDDKMSSRYMVLDKNTDNFYLLVFDEDATNDEYILRFNSSGTQSWARYIHSESIQLGWSPHMRLNNNNLYFIGSSISFAVGGSSWGSFVLKRYDLNGNLNGYIASPTGVSVILGDVGFYDNSVFLVGGTYSGTWGNQSITTSSTNYADYFLAKLSSSNLDITTSISKESVIEEIQLSPNPVADFVYVTLPQENEGQLLLCDITGRTISSINANGYESSFFDTRELSKGTYIISYQNSSKVFSKLFVK